MISLGSFFLFCPDFLPYLTYHKNKTPNLFSQVYSGHDAGRLCISKYS